MTSLSMPALSVQPPERGDPIHRPFAPHLAVQIVGTVFFGIFAIVATVLAFEAFWLAGMVVALVLALRGFGPIFGRGHLRRAANDAQATAPQMPWDVTGRDATGNASFDAYRAEVLQRLEDERVSFVGFLDRLRDAKDKTEFDRFMTDRAKGAQAVAGIEPQSDR